MKTEITTKKEFTPITVTITIESKRELEALLCYTNAPSYKKVYFMNQNLFDDIERFCQNESQLLPVNFDEWGKLKKML